MSTDPDPRIDPRSDDQLRVERDGVLASSNNYADVQRLVDQLSDAGFPVQRVRIVGNGLRSVEQVTGRLTKGRAALAGAGTGAWFGLLIGLLIGFFAPGPAWFALLLWSVLLGALWGAAFGFIAHWGTRGRRDFSSVQSLSAASYDLVTDPDTAAEAKSVLEGGAAGEGRRPTA